MNDTTRKPTGHRDEQQQDLSPASQDREGRVGKYGGDDGALEHERAVIEPGEDTGIEAVPHPDTPAEERQRPS